MRGQSWMLEHVEQEMKREESEARHRAAVAWAKGRLRERATWPWWKRVLSKLNWRSDMAEVVDIKALDVQRVAEEAARELREEKMAEGKKRIKEHLRKLEAAKAVVANLERERDDILASIAEGN